MKKETIKRISKIEQRIGEKSRFIFYRSNIILPGKENNVPIIWKMLGKNFVRQIDGRSKEGLEIINKK